MVNQAEVARLSGEIDTIIAQLEGIDPTSDEALKSYQQIGNLYEWLASEKIDNAMPAPEYRVTELRDEMTSHERKLNELRQREDPLGASLLGYAEFVRKIIQNNTRLIAAYYWTEAHPELRELPPAVLRP